MTDAIDFPTPGRRCQRVLRYSRRMRARMHWPMALSLLLLVAFAGALAAAPRPARAVTPVGKGFSQLVQEAELIVVGVVVSTRSLELAGGAIVTDVALDHVRVLKATLPT